ncbi:hypothetical protein ID866_8267 [Astraeus odoratus]|nr:hypothetical protein ID866_8267 [Astraeus odoratus]
MPAVTKRGTLTIAGSGIASIKHITLETLSHIEQADKVYYGVTDPATEAFIRDKSKGDCSDLRVYYDTNKHRYESYVQMCEVMLKDVRAGNDVLGIFYGHPGVFVSPSHRAIAIARDEGFQAKMLPGISAEDYMFADLGFDPAIPGCMTQEATAIVVQNKKLDPSVHNIIWQVGGVGVHDMVFDNAQFHHLVDRLEEDFGPDHKVMHYIGAVLPQSATVMEEYTIADLRKEEVVKQFNPVSTFYVPPRDVTSFDKATPQKLGASGALARVHPMQRFPYSKLLGIHSPAAPAYGPFEQAAIERLKTHKPSNDAIKLQASPAIRQFMTDLALSPSLLAQYKANPGAIVDTISGLSEQEKFALKLDKPGPVRAVMRGNYGGAAYRKETSFDEKAVLLQSFDEKAVLLQTFDQKAVLLQSFDEKAVLLQSFDERAVLLQSFDEKAVLLQSFDERAVLLQVN